MSEKRTKPSYGQAAALNLKLEIQPSSGTELLTREDVSYFERWMGEDLLSSNLKSRGIITLGCCDGPSLTALRLWIRGLLPREGRIVGYTALGPEDRPPQRTYTVWVPVLSVRKDASAFNRILGMQNPELPLDKFHVQGPVREKERPDGFHLRVAVEFHHSKSWTLSLISWVAASSTLAADQMRLTRTSHGVIYMWIDDDGD